MFGNTAYDTEAFQNCTLLRKITLPLSIKKLTHYMFQNCTSLSYLQIPGSVESTTLRALEGCTSLQEIIFDESGKGLYIDQQTFYRCTSLKHLVLPARTTEIGQNLLYGTNVEELYIKATNPPILSGGFNNNSLKVLYVPIGSLTLYQEATNWNNYKNIMVEYDFEINHHHV